MSSKRDQAHQRPPQRDTASRAQATCALIVALTVLLNPQALSARCLIAAEEGAPLSQGDVIADLAGMGGTQGGGYSLGGRLGLTGDRELQLRVGGCQRDIQSSRDDAEVSLWGNGVSLGLKQGLLSAKQTGAVALSVSIATELLDASDGQERGEAYTSLGLTPTALVSYPFSITANREGFITLRLSGGVQFIDRNLQDSHLEFHPVIGLSGGAEILPLLSLRGALNWQDGGAFGGASIAYRF